VNKLFPRTQKARAAAYRMNRWKGLRADQADEERQQAQRSRWLSKCRRIARWAGLAAGVTAMLWGGIAAIHEMGPMIQRGLEIRELQIEGVQHVTKQEVLDRLALKKGIALHQVSLSYLAERVRALVWIKEVTVERLPPHTLRVTVAERIPAAIVLIGSEHFLTDDEGVNLFRLGERDDPALPLLTGADMTAFLQGESHVRHAIQSSIGLAKVMAPSLEDRVRIDLSNPVNLVASAKGVRYQFGGKAVLDQWNRFRMVKAVFRSGSLDGRKQEGGEVDLRYDNRVIVRERG